MALVDRARQMIVAPAAEWPIVAMEPTPIGTLVSGYIVPLALIPPVCALLSAVLFTHRNLVVAGVGAVVTFVLGIVGVAVVALIAEALAPSFDGRKDRGQAFKWVGYAYTPSWVAGIALLIPIVGALVALVGSIYSLYVLYLGASPVMGIPPNKAVGYAVVVVVAAIVVYAIVGGITLAILGTLAAGALLTTGIGR